MNGRISAALVAMGAMVLFAGGAADRAVAQTSSRQMELSASNVQDDRQDSRQDNGQQRSAAKLRLPATRRRPG